MEISLPMRLPTRFLPTLALGTLASLLCAAPTAAQTLAIQPATVHQTVRGFGGIALPEWMGSDLTETQRASAFGNADGQMGLTILRIWINPDSTQWNKAVPTAKAALARGAIVFATPWYPPASMRSDAGTATAKYTMNTSAFADYATYLNKFLAYMKGQGVDIHAISIQNEPDYAKDWTQWTDDQVYQFTRDHAGKINGRVITAESYQYRKALYDKILNDPAALANIDIVGTHTYGTKVADFAYPLFDQKAAPAGKERWMTEHYTESASDADVWPLALDVATDVQNSMVEGDFNAYVWWYIRRSYGPMKEDGSISKRGHCLSHFAKFVRPGAVRIEATKAPTAGVSVSAYRKGDSVVVVAVNTNSAPKTMTATVSGLTTGTYAKFTTSATKSMAKDGSGKVSGGSFTAYADAQSVVTWVVLPETPTSADRSVRPAPLGGVWALRDVSGRSLGQVEAHDAAQLRDRIVALAPGAGLVFAKPLDGGAVRRLEILR